ncbi:Phosphoethanolamine N-methyltransferase 3 [Fusarium agapanthi]|uniref:Phosphoethanolamine N-methyltransferase 3 n=1 Tax=Fusarium agapanthi TaxID=1803897 RepID=A0A9P5B020_9HYPO|nr:Phosphoethanolamine N-methyltransferase 3 [Fusarium agapanthi]
MSSPPAPAPVSSPEQVTQTSQPVAVANTPEQLLESAAPHQPEQEPVIDDDSALSAGVDYADEHPNTAVIGTDLSTVQPDWVPPNLKFEIDDCTKPWTWDANTFDFVHMRYLFGAIRDWTSLFKEAYNAVKPGGWVESCESEPMTHSDDGTVKDDGSTALGGTWDKMFIEGGKATGCSLSVLTEDLQMKAMKEAGFVDIQETFYKIPFGSWPKDPKMAEIGQYAKLSLESDLVGYSQMIWHEVLKWPAEEYQIFLMQARFVWGRKPETEQK